MSAVRRVGQVFLFALLCLGVAELGLAVGSLFVGGGGPEGWREGATIRVLSIGDSHTYGGSVAEGENYPAQLQRFLDEAAPGVYSVVNIGIPGTNTAQIRNRLGINLARWRPTILILWCGINNTWNNSERTSSDRSARLDAIALRSRLYKFARVWLHERSLSEDVKRRVEGGRHELRPIGMVGHDVPYFGKIFASDRERVRIDPDIENWAAEDFAAMVRMARAAGVEVLFITYHLESRDYSVPNRAMRRVGDDLGVPVVAATEAFARVPEDQERFSWKNHPSGPVYGEVARDVAAWVLARGR